jgi:hypothetical protein
MINFDAMNCVIEENTLKGTGVFGLRRYVTFEAAQKVYFRINLIPNEVMKVQIGIVDGGILYMTEKRVHKKACISVVHTAKSQTVELVLICDTVYKDAEVEITNMVVKPIGKSLIPKGVLDRIPYNYKDCKNLSVIQPFALRSIGNHACELPAELEKGRRYLIKVLAEERTNCGEVWLDCGTHDKKDELITEFVYTGRYPHLRIKANKFEYIVDVKAVVIVDAEEISMSDFRAKLYWR